MSERELTGRTVFIWIASAFSLIIAVNIFMAYKAIKTFPGLETRNSYVASQKFDTSRAAQVALGWDVSAIIENQELLLTIVDADGLLVEVASLEATLGRATHVGEDQTPEFTFTSLGYVADALVANGNWNLRMVAVADDGTEFRQRVIVDVRD